jgi:hypothetical protein
MNYTARHHHDRSCAATGPSFRFGTLLPLAMSCANRRHLTILFVGVELADAYPF